MYAVVGCRECDALWVVEGQPGTTGCPRCGKRHRFDRLRTFAETDDEDRAKQARAAILAERSGHGDAFADLADFADMEAAVDDAVVPDEEYLGGAGIDVDEVEAAGDGARRGQGAGGASRPETVKAALRDLDAPTKGIDLPLGLGSRHMAGAAISKLARTVAIVVSESSVVRIFARGDLITEIVPEIWMLHRYGLAFGDRARTQVAGDVTVVSK